MKTSIICSMALLCSLSLVLISCGTDANDKETNPIEIVSINPGSPANLSYGDYVFITFEYSIASSEGARMWVQPYTKGSISPRYSYSSSTIFYGEGSRNARVSISQGTDPVTVDQLRVVMVTPNQSETLYETFMGVNYNFNE